MRNSPANSRPRHDLVLVARDSGRLDARRAELTGEFGVDVEVLSADLITDAGCGAVAARIVEAQRPVDVLVNSAGFGMYRRFGLADLADEERQLDLNVRAVLRLSHAAVRSMTSRGAGKTINISSVAAFVPRAGNTTYSARKAWVTMFSEGLAVQLAGSGATVTALCPGFTHTEFHERASADMSHVPDRMWLNVQTVVAEGLADAANGRAVSVPNRRYKVLVSATRTLPRPLLDKIMARRAR